MIVDKNYWKEWNEIFWFKKYILCCDIPHAVGQDICQNKPESTYD
jgi:hypothetical protein